MPLETGETHSQTVWNKLPLGRLKQLHDFIVYEKLEPVHAKKLIDDLLDFSEQISEMPFVHAVLEEVSNPPLTYRSATFKRNYRLIYRIDEKKWQVIITNLFHNKRHPKWMKR